MHVCLTGVHNVVDLCAAPGSWSQVLSHRLYLPALQHHQQQQQQQQLQQQATLPSRDSPLPRIVAIDLQPMAPIEGVTQLQGDITSERTAAEVISHFDGGQADLVVCDGAPDVTGLHDLDEYVQTQLLLAAMTIVAATLRQGGTFVAKIFRGKDISLLYSQLAAFFTDVAVAKPKSSRNSSIEAFVVCRGYTPPVEFEPSSLRKVLQSVEAGYPEAQNTSQLRKLVPFVACGDLGGWDADASYELPEEGYSPLPPVQPPTAPAYRSALEKARTGSLS